MSSATAVLMSLSRSGHLVGPPDAEAEPVQVDVLAPLALAGVPAVQRQPQERPYARLLAGVVVPVGVAIGLHHPPPRAPVGPGVARLLLPTLEHPLGHLQGGLERLGV